MIYAGIVLVIIGLIIRQYAIMCLKKHRQIAMTGAYKYIRHPCYVGSIFVIAGLSLIYIPLAVTYLAFALFLALAWNEEQLLINNPDYREYRKSTGMFLPRIKNG